MTHFLSLTLAVAMAGCTGAPSAPDYDYDAPLPDASLYQVDAAWTTDAEAQTTLADLRGTTVVMTMGYTSCGYACPMLVQEMKGIARLLPEGSPVHFVLVSMDPERDTAERLRQFREAHGLEGDWTLLVGQASDVRTLAALLEIRYRNDEDGAISHSNVITVLDRDGVIAARQEGLGADPASTVAAIQEAFSLNL